MRPFWKKKPAATVPCRLVMPNVAHLVDYIRQNAPYAKDMVHPGDCKGQTVNVCGAGPSLADFVDNMPFAHQTWGCNSALLYLHDKGARPTHGFCVDQNEEMLRPDEWGRVLPITYYVASSCHPKLIQHLLAEGRKLRWFHNYLGLDDPPDWDAKARGKSYEMALYTDPSLYESGMQVGHGLNSTQRAVCLAVAMGFKKVRVFGADCTFAPNSPPMPDYHSPDYTKWLGKVRAYADGRSALEAYGPGATVCEGVIDGIRWHSRSDMIVSARHTVELVRTFPDRIELMGNTLPKLMLGKDEAFMRRMPSLAGTGTVAGLGVAPSKKAQVA